MRAEKITKSGRAHWCTFVAFIAIVLGLGGCAFMERSPASSYYILTAQEAPQSKVIATESLDSTIAIGPIMLPGYLDRNQIFLRQNNDVDVHIAEFHLWAEPLDEGIGRVLSTVISNALSAKNILVVSLRDTGSRNWKIRIDINRFDGSLGKSAVLDARWVLFDYKGDAHAQGIFVDSEPSGDSITSLVHAQSELLQRFALVLAKRMESL